MDHATPSLPSPSPSPAQLATLPAIPLERLCLPADLSGALGANRAAGAGTQIAAQDDVAAITAGWRATPTAGRPWTYRRDVERLLLWAVQQRGKPLSSLTHEDLLLYQRFLADPSRRRAG